MPNGDDYDGLRQAAGGDIRPTAELLGMTFTIIDFETVETRFKDEKGGGNKSTHIATIVPEGEEEQIRYWLGGVKVNRQLAWLKTTGRLPFRTKLGGEGNQEAPYELMEPDEKATKRLTKVTKPTSIKARASTPIEEVTRGLDNPDDALSYFRTGDGKLDGRAFVKWWEEQELTSNDLAGVIGQPTMSALQSWFDADATRTTSTLLEEARGNADLPWGPDRDEELPFE